MIRRLAVLGARSGKALAPVSARFPRCALCLPIIAVLVAPRSIAAHPINTALSVVSKDAIRIGHGLVTRDPQGRWRFVCPTAWGGPPTPLALALDDERMVVIGDLGAMEMTIDGIVSPLSSRMDAAHTREVERAGSLVLALANEADGSVIAAFEPGIGRELVVERSWLHSIEGTADGFVVTSSTVDGVRLTEHRIDGSPLDSRVVRYSEIRTATVGIERAGGDLYALLAHPSEFRLARIEGDRLRLIATSQFPILGPVHVGDETWFVEDGALLRIAGADVEVIDQSQTYSCLEEHDATSARACIGRQIFVMRPGTAPELLFDLTEVKGPRLSSFDPEDRVACEFEWTIFAGEAGVDPTIPEDKVDEPGCGCTATPSVERADIFILLVLSICLRACRQRSGRIVGLRANFVERARR